MVPTTTNPSKYPKLHGERAVKAPFGGNGGGGLTKTTSTTKNFVVKGTGREVGKVEDDVKKRMVGDSVSHRREKEYSTSTETLLEWEDWPRFSTLSDEQMLWGSLWIPCSDETYSAMDGLCALDEILWEDDLWNLKAIKEIPTKP